MRRREERFFVSGRTDSHAAAAVVVGVAPKLIPKINILVTDRPSHP